MTGGKLSPELMVGLGAAVSLVAAMGARGLYKLATRGAPVVEEEVPPSRATLSEAAEDELAGELAEEHAVRKHAAIKEIEGKIDEANKEYTFDLNKAVVKNNKEIAAQNKKQNEAAVKAFKPGTSVRDTYANTEKLKKIAEKGEVALEKENARLQDKLKKKVEALDVERSLAEDAYNEAVAHAAEEAATKVANKLSRAASAPALITY